MQNARQCTVSSYCTGSHHSMETVILCVHNDIVCACNNALTWLQLYLSDRTKKFLGVMSLPISINCSIPRGSVLGPFEFITCTEDTGIIKVFKKHAVRHHLYADNKLGYLDVPLQDTISHNKTSVSRCTYILLKSEDKLDKSLQEKYERQENSNSNILVDQVWSTLQDCIADIRSWCLL